MTEPMIVFDSLINTDYCRFDTAQDAVAAMFADAKKINKASLYYAWAVGKFLDGEKFKQKYKITIAELAELMGTSEQTLYRYKVVAKTLPRHELEKLADLGVSIRAVTYIASIEKDHKEEAKILMNSLLNGDVITKDDVSIEFSNLLKSRTAPHNLLPCADRPQEDVIETVDEITEAIVVSDSGESPGDNILNNFESDDKDIKKVVDNKEYNDDDDDEEYEDDSVDINFESRNECSQNTKDAKAMLRNIRNYIAPLRRDVVSIKNNIKEQMDKIRSDYSVVLGDKDSTEACDEIIFDFYRELTLTIPIIVDELIEGVKSGNIMNPVPIPEDAERIFDGKCLFSYSE